MTAPLHKHNRQESGRCPSFQGIFHPFCPLQDSAPKGRRANDKVTRTEFELTTDSEAEQEFELFTDSEAEFELSTLLKQ
jgi:hypothetical protein